MKPIRVIGGRVFVLDRADVDTDQIIPAQFMKRIERTGFGQFLFHAWVQAGTVKLEKVPILVAGRNFGCGSSREHAVWALQQYGFRAVIAPSFADIFHKNCFENGLLPIVLQEPVVQQLMATASARPGYRLTVDLERCVISDDEGTEIPFGVEAFPRYCLLNGLDAIGLTLRHEDKIRDYERRRWGRSW